MDEINITCRCGKTRTFKHLDMLSPNMTTVTRCECGREIGFRVRQVLEIIEQEEDECPILGLTFGHPRDVFPCDIEHCSIFYKCREEARRR